MLKTFALSSAMSFILLSGVILNTPVNINDKEVEIAQYLQDISVTLACNDNQCSGVLHSTKDGQVWIWTCGHTISHIRQIVINNDKSETIKFGNVVVIKEERENGELICEHYYNAEVIRYSAKEDEDISLLRLKNKNFKLKNSTKFKLDMELPKIGSRIYTCGSYFGQPGYNSFAAGYMSQYARMYEGSLFDQIQCTAFPGASGSGVFDINGYYVGMITRGMGESATYVVPLRRMKRWAEQENILFAMDDSLPVPTRKDLISGGIDHTKSVKDDD